MAMHNTNDEELDVVVVGAGIYGIQFARTYLSLHPRTNLTILESDDTVGGVWSANRTYAHFTTQTPLGMAEFSDQPLSPPPPKDEQYYGFFPSRYFTAYLESYIDSHVYAGRTLRSLVRFNTRVDNARKTADEKGWILSYQNTAHDKRGVMRTAKLVDATGLTSRPLTPHIPILSTSSPSPPPLTLHQKDFGAHQSAILSPKPHSPYKNIVILGGAKSAADIVYACAKVPGNQVSWVIREDGNGPAAFLDAKGRAGYANSNEAFYTRFMAAWLPNVFSFERAVWCNFGRLLHGTRGGRWLVERVWRAVNDRYRREVGFGREGRERLAALEPDTPVFWQNDSAGINQREDFWEVVAEKVDVYRRNVECIDGDKVVLAPKAGSEEKALRLPLDVLVYGTGWSPESSIFPPNQAVAMGLAVPVDQADPTLMRKWDDLEKSADSAIISQFPMLAHPPPHHHKTPSTTPFRLYKAMVPPFDTLPPSIVFLGKMVVGNNFRVAEAQALWATAYLDGHIKCNPEDMHRDIARTVAWCRRRYLNKGQLGSYFFFDVLDYTDMLLAQLGLSSHKSKEWYERWFGPCRARDLRGLVDEYRTLHPS